MNQISAKLAELLLGSGDHAGNLGPLVGQRRHDVTFRHIHPRSQNDRADYLLQVDMMSAMRLVRMRHDTDKLLRGLETYVAGQAELIIDYAAARHDAEPISTAPTESTVQWLLHRRMGANHQMRWSPRGAHMMLKVRTAGANGTLERDYAIAERWARRPFRRAA